MKKDLSTIVRVTCHYNFSEKVGLLKSESIVSHNNRNFVVIFSNNVTGNHNLLMTWCSQLILFHEAFGQTG